jgi:hypothetical protein
MNKLRIDSLEHVLETTFRSMLELNTRFLNISELLHNYTDCDQRYIQNDLVNIFRNRFFRLFTVHPSENGDVDDPLIELYFDNVKQTILTLLKCDEDILKCVKTFIPN